MERGRSWEGFLGVVVGNERFFSWGVGFGVAELLEGGRRWLRTLIFFHSTIRSGFVVVGEVRLFAVARCGASSTQTPRFLIPMSMLTMRPLLPKVRGSERLCRITLSSSAFVPALGTPMSQAASFSCVAFRPTKTSRRAIVAG